ncbi:phenylalanine--tRNA ligase subunit alpha [Candidatus Parcubacteria bacterium]|nr:MAG: phenylalanine--tRNA ligase subunit alpha [Candidatus Parcubacteria bacterium]
MQAEILSIKQKALKELDNCASLEQLQQCRIKYLGRKSRFSQLLRALAQLSTAERKEAGKIANLAKRELIEAFKKKEDELLGASSLGVDVTLPGELMPAGRLHPITQIIEELEDLFSYLGFISWEGPELESDFFNFTALNIPPHHPAREMQDTFYLDLPNEEDGYDLVMRTHTSPVQVRAMRHFGAPLRVIVPGRCFRNEATDVRHEHTFYQLEGLLIDKEINFSHLKGVLEIVGRHLYGPNTRLRLRPKFYPFVEPGANGEYTCFLCKGEGCRLCKHTGWLEVLGCGMVHPNVLRAGGIDPNKYQGFAFGFGLNRLVMLKYGIEDIRLFNSGDLRFLNQF